MNGTRANLPPIRLAGSELRDVRHVCAFFHSEDERYRVLLPFMSEGLACGDKAVHIVSPGEHAGHRHRLAEAGIDVDGAEERGELEVLSSTDVYLRDGRFDQDRMLNVFERLAMEAQAEGRVGRFVCEMEWAAAEGNAHIDDLIAFESRVNDLWIKHPDVVICVYDLAKFDGQTVIDIVRTHPIIIIGGVLQENPFYVPPAQFLAEIRARRTTSDSRAP